MASAGRGGVVNATAENKTLEASSKLGKTTIFLWWLLLKCYNENQSSERIIKIKHKLVCWLFPENNFSFNPLACRAKDRFHYLHTGYDGAFSCPYMQNTHRKGWTIKKNVFRVIIKFSPHRHVWSKTETIENSVSTFLECRNIFHLCPTRNQWGTHFSSLLIAFCRVDVFCSGRGREAWLTCWM